jgi:hypothetical protein
MLVRRHGFADTAFAFEAYPETAVVAVFRCRSCVVLLSFADEPALTSVTAVPPYLFSDSQPETKRLRNIGLHGRVTVPAAEEKRNAGKQTSGVSTWREQYEVSPVRQREKKRPTKR